MSKIQILKANHNIYGYRNTGKYIIVRINVKDTNFESKSQLHFNHLCFSLLLSAICQRYHFESKSQRLLVTVKQYMIVSIMSKIPF